jgi:hypothetical protein
MSTAALPFEVPRPVAQKVARLRRMVRFYSLGEGLAAVAVVAGIAFWVGLAVDWIFEPSPALRLAMWGAAVIAAAATAWRFIGRRLLVPLPDDSLALLVERKYPHLREGMVTTVQAASRPRRGSDDWDRNAGAGSTVDPTSEVSRQLLIEASRRTASAMPHIELRRVFDMRPLARKAAAALVLWGAIALFAMTQSEAFAFYAQRLQLSHQPWPRSVQLTVVGFEDRSDAPPVNVARDDEFPLTVLASIVDGHVAPSEVEIRWRRPADGGRGGGPMLRIGEAQRGRDKAQEFGYTFKVSSDLEFDVVGGDDRVRNLRLRAVERPAITRIWLEIEYPAYMGREPRSVPVSGRAEMPEGSRAICWVEANKPLVAATVRDSTAQKNLPATIDTSQPKRIRIDIPVAAEDRVLAIELQDADGVGNRDPFRLPVSIVPDQAPEATVQLRGIGSAVTPQAMIPFAGAISDDYGIEEAWFDLSIDEGYSDRRPLRNQPHGMSTMAVNETFDLSETDPATKQPVTPVQPGQKLSLSVKARDAYDLAEEPHVGSSQRFVLDVVTPSELRSILERRELGLRQRFEAIYEKMRGVGELLERIDLAAAATGADDATGVSVQSASGEAGSAEGTSPPDESSSSEESDRLRQRDQSRIGGSRQSSAQLAFETGGVATGFDEIVAELINNRVETEELKERLEQGISEPLKQISGEMLPALEAQLGALENAYRTAPSEAAEPLAAAKSAAESTEAAMKAVLDRMLELEEYNELVELLRGIVKDQEQLKERTQQQQRERLRGLLDD